MSRRCGVVVLALSLVAMAAGCELPRAWQTTWLLTCESPPFDRSVLDEPPVPADSTDPAAVAMRAALADWGFGIATEDDPLFELYRDDELAVFMVGHLPAIDADVPSGQGGPVVSVRRIDGVWRPWGGSSGCDLRTIVDGHGSADWWLDLSHPLPGPEDTEIHAVVMERNCASGGDAVGRVREPRIEVLADAIIVGISVTPKGGFQSCPGNQPTPYVIELPEPRGDRPLFDGGSYPALWAMPEPWRSWAASGGA